MEAWNVQKLGRQTNAFIWEIKNPSHENDTWIQDELEAEGP